MIFILACLVLGGVGYTLTRTKSAVATLVGLAFMLAGVWVAAVGLLQLIGRG